MIFFSGEAVVDHVTTDSNPAYMVVQKIDMSSNSAYATSSAVKQ